MSEEVNIAGTDEDSKLILTDKKQTLKDNDSTLLQDSKSSSRLIGHKIQFKLPEKIKSFTILHLTDDQVKSTDSSVKTISTESDITTKTVTYAATDKSITASDTSEDNTSEVNDTVKEDVTEYDPKDITYEGDIAIYTNPSTGHKYEWNKESESWVLKESVGSYGFENDTHTYTDQDGVTFEWDKDKNAWFPKIDDEFMAHYQLSYGFTDTDSNDKPATVEKPKIVKPIAKPKEQLLPGQKRKPSDPKWFEQDHDQNTKVYVSSLPLDITDEEFLELMQKCGIIMRDPVTNQMRIKLYKDLNSDNLKGDGLCTYVRRESVELALKLIDGSELRGNKIKVELAEFQMKGNYDPKLKPKSKKRKEKIKLKQQQEKMFDWRPEKMIGERAKHERIVVIKNVFESKMFDDDVGLILEFQQDLRDECAKLGDVRKVVLYDRHPEGVAQVNMAAAEEADEVVKLLNGRWFGKRKLSAEIWDGKTKYKVQETDSQITERIGNWDKFLEDEANAEEMEDA